MCTRLEVSQSCMSMRWAASCWMLDCATPCANWTVPRDGVSTWMRYRYRQGSSGRPGEDMCISFGPGHLSRHLSRRNDRRTSNSLRLYIMKTLVGGRF